MRAIIIGICLFCCLPALAQKYQLASSQVSFFSSAPVEDIEAKTSKTRSLLNSKTGELAFVIPIRSFGFDKQLMQEHFNENYMESEKYPEATFKGKLTGYERDKKGKQPVVARGEMTIHGVSRSIEAEGVIEFKGKDLFVEATFPVKVADHDIEIPQVLFYNIAEVVEVKLKGTYKLYEKR